MGQQPIYLSTEEYSVFERFLQYGDLKNASLVFVGMEEGLHRDGFSAAIEQRLRWGNHELQNPFIEFLNGLNYNDGFYINDMCLSGFKEAKRKQPGLEWDEYVSNDSLDSTMRYQARIKYLVDTNFNDYKAGDQIDINKIKNHVYNILHRKSSKSAMIDIFPLPKQDDFPYRIEGLNLKSYDEYTDYCLAKDNPRVKLISSLYNNSPMRVSIIYAGIKHKRFKLYNFYRNLGFQFKQLNANSIHEYFTEIFANNFNNLSSKPVFLLGKRKGYNQWALLTSFFGNGQISNEQVDVIASWASLCLKDQISFEEIPGIEIGQDYSIPTLTPKNRSVKIKSIVNKKFETTVLHSTKVDSQPLIIPGKKGVTNKQMIEAINRHVLAQDQNSINNLKQLYPRIFQATLRYLRKNEYSQLKIWGFIVKE